jgi:7-cyano-7-deazaguanine synthase
MKKCVVLLSGGIDSSTTLFLAKDAGFSVYALFIRYNQRHIKEFESASNVAKKAEVPLYTATLRIPLWKSSLIPSSGLRVRTSPITSNIPQTYVPSRNIIFLSIAFAFAESIGARDIFIGANCIDYSGYPDCTPKFFNSLQKVFSKGTKMGVQGNPIKIHTPLLRYTKSKIVRLGFKIGVPIHMTWSCYLGEDKPCGKCDSCRIRNKALKDYDKR